MKKVKDATILLMAIFLVGITVSSTFSAKENSIEGKCEGAIGDIKLSMLSYSDFVTENGKGWIKAEGQRLNADTQLGSYFGNIGMPNLNISTTKPLLMGVSSGTAKSGQNIWSASKANKGISWRWLPSSREIEGNEKGDLWEYGKDRFHVRINNDGRVVAAGSTHSWKFGSKWAPWNENNTINYIGVGTQNVKATYYIKVNDCQ